MSSTAQQSVHDLCVTDTPPRLTAYKKKKSQFHLRHGGSWRENTLVEHTEVCMFSENKKQKNKTRAGRWTQPPGCGSVTVAAAVVPHHHAAVPLLLLLFEGLLHLGSLQAAVPADAHRNRVRKKQTSPHTT